MMAVSPRPPSPTGPFTSVRDVREAEIVGDQPDRELNGSKRWIIFKHPTFDKYISTTFTLTNEDPFTVAFCIKSRDRTIFLIDEPYGILGPNETVKLKLYLKKAELWSRQITFYADVRHQLCIENLRVPAEIRPATRKIGREMSRDIFKRTVQRNPMQRLYWKMHIVIKVTNKDGDTSPKEGGSKESISLGTISA